MGYLFEVEKGVPVPPPPMRGKAGEVAAVLESMEVGDSFIYTDDKNKNQHTRIKYAAKKLGIKMTVRIIEENKFRAWRVE